MILKRLKLHNYRQHADLDRNLDGTLIAIIGPNGSGKSNLLGAIQYAFTGEQPGFKKCELLRWGSDEGDVVIEFDHNGTPGIITRALHTSGASLQYGKELFRGASAVTDALRLHLELDKDLSKQVVFVRQAEIDAILFTDPRVRELAFQRLMGIGDASKIHKTLGDGLAELGEPQNYDEQIAEGKKRWAELHQRLQVLQVQLTTMKDQRSKIPTMAAIKENMAVCHSQIQAIERLITIRQQVIAQAYVVQGLRQQITDLPIDLASVSEIDKELELLRAQQNEAQQYQRVFTAWRTAGEAVVALGAAPVTEKTLKVSREAYQSISATVNQVLGELQLHENLRKALQAGVHDKLEECPVCGSTVKDKDALFNRLTKIIAKLSTDIHRLQAQEIMARTVVDQTQQAWTQYQQTYTARTAAYAQADKAVKAVKEVHADLNDLQSKILQGTTRRTQIINAGISRTSLESKCNTELQHLDSLTAQASAAEQAAVTVQLPTEADTPYGIILQERRTWITQWEQQREILQQLDTELARLEGTVTELTTTMATLDKTVAALEYKRSTQAGYKAAVATLNRVRDWFHYNNGPHVLSTGILGALNQDVNKFLGQFTAPFTVEPSNDALGFNCYFTDGRTMPAAGAPDASVLSGGEKIQLAVAFRFAAYCMFASKLGLLSLDEPTAYLDDQNVGRFGDLLQQIKRVAQGMNLQVLMATHERCVIPFMDTTIDLTQNTIDKSKVNSNE